MERGLEAGAVRPIGGQSGHIPPVSWMHQRHAAVARRQVSTTEFPGPLHKNDDTSGSAGSLFDISNPVGNLDGQRRGPFLLEHDLRRYG